MSYIDDLLTGKCNAMQRRFEPTVWPRQTRSRGCADMPGIRCHSDDYVTFLRRDDGLDFNGYVIYGATEHKASILPGLSSRTSNLAGGNVAMKPSDGRSSASHALFVRSTGYSRDAALCACCI